MIRRAPLSVVAIVALLLCSGGCGDGAPATPRPNGERQVERDQVPAIQNESIGSFGVRASASQRDAAAAALRSYLRAHVDGDWRVACSYVSAPARQLLLDAAARSRYADSPCFRVLSVFLGNPPRSERRGFSVVDPVVLKLRRSRGVLLYRGDDSTEYAIEMIVERGKWKVGALAPVPLP